MSSLRQIYLFVDTNFFLQLKVAAELPWREVGTNCEILLLIPRAVQKEVSRLKSDGNSRRAKRARRAAADFKRIAQAANAAEVVRETDPLVRFVLSPLLPIAHDPTLDPGDTDDRIIAEILSFCGAYPDRDVRLLSTDSDQIVSAKHFGIPFVVVPDTWQLDPELDSRDKVIAEQRREIAQLRELEPRVEVLVAPSPALEVLDFSPLNEAEVDVYVSEVAQRYPMTSGLDKLVGLKSPRDPHLSLLSVSGLYRFEPVSQEEVNAYVNVQYPGWLENLRSYLLRLHEHSELDRRTGTFEVKVQNDSFRTAEGMTVTFELKGGPLFGTFRQESLERRPPEPPTAPSGRMVETVRDRVSGPRPYFDNFRSQLADPHDPYAFYRTQGGDSPRSTLSFECDLFRHGGRAEEFSLPFIVPVGVDTDHALFRVEIFARNMSKLVVHEAPIRISHLQANTLETAQESIDRYFPRRREITIISETQSI